MVMTKTTEKTNSGGCRVELCDLVLLNCLPVTRWRRVNRRRFEDGRSDTICKWSVDDIGLPSDAPDISHACEFVVWVNIKDVFNDECSTKDVTASGVNNTLGFTSRSRSVHELDGFGKLRQLSGWKTVTPARGFVHCDFTSSMSVLSE